MTTSCLRNMSPHFYIVYFVINVKWSICYEYDPRDANAIRDANNSPEITHDQRRNTKLGKNPNAEFDLAEFLNVADEIALGDGNYDYNVKSQHNSKHYNEYDSIIDNAADNVEKRDDTSDFLNGAYNQVDTNMNPSEIKNLYNDRQFKIAGLNNYDKLINNRDDKAVTMKVQDKYVDRSLSHHPEKKCSFKNMKFPFFSHNKSPTSKKAKKKKMFCLNCKKKDTSTTSTEAYDMRNKNKRSYYYVEKLCPECQRKFRAEVQENVDNMRMMHNSRQYFADIDNQAKEKLENKRWTKKEDIATNFANPIQNSRRKRDDSDDRDRQLQELDLIQKKVDQIQMPRFEKPVQL